MTVYRKNWSDDIVDDYITRESQQKTKSQFLNTHVPINRIAVADDGGALQTYKNDEGYIDEEGFYQAVTDASLADDNRIFFVVGESGCGKSELCQWLDYQIDDGQSSVEFERRSIVVPRQVREPADVIDILSEDLDKEFNDVQKLRELPQEGVHKQAIGTILNEFPNEPNTVAALNSDDISEKITTNLNNYIKSYDDPQGETNFEPLSRDTVEDLLDRGIDIKSEHEGAENPVNALYERTRSAAERAIKQMLGDVEISEILKDLNEEYQNQDIRPTLIIEDLAGFTVYDYELLGFFSDLSAAQFDVVIGVTTGPYEETVSQFRQDIQTESTINDRIRARFQLTETTEEGGSRTLFLEQENLHIELARKYLQQIKTESDTDFDDLPDDISPDAIEESFGEGLYPFNKAFLTRVYENLESENVEKRTPRQYLEFVLKTLLKGANPPFEQAELIEVLGDGASVPISGEYDDQDRDVLNWYGTHTGDEITVDTVIPRTFGVDSDGRAPAVYERRTDVGSAGSTSGNSGESSDPSLEENLNSLKDECAGWLAGDTTFDRTQDLEHGVARALKFFDLDNNPRTLRRPECRSEDRCRFLWDRGRASVPVHVDNEDDSGYTKVIVDRDMEEALLHDLLRIGVYDGTAIDELAKQRDIDIQRLREWATTTLSGFRTKLLDDIETEFGASIDEVALFGKYLLNIVSGNGAEFSPEALATPVDTSRINPVCVPRNAELDPKGIEDEADTITALFHSRFHLRTTMVDYDRLQTHVESTSPDELLHAVANTESGIRGFKIGPRGETPTDFQQYLVKTGGLNLRTKARNLREYREQYHDDIPLINGKQIEDFTSPFKNLDSPSDLDLETLYEACQYSVDHHAESDIEAFEDISEENYRELVTALSETAKRFDTEESIWEFLATYHMYSEFKYRRYNDEFSTIEDFGERIDNLTADLEHRMEELRDDIGFKPETAPLDELQAQAESLRSDLGETL
jgi:ABC-type oligopeptide transport system ATPase subunit